MQFKHPEILYFLALLIIPIIVHLFQLQRFTKVSFTNVAFLKKIALQTRKSSQIKKWLTLITRLLMLTALILAFAQPFFSNQTLDKKQHVIIYLDNSLSMDAKGNKGKLLQTATQDIIENMSAKSNFTLITNDNYHNDITSEELKSILLNIKSTSIQTNFNDVLLKIANENKKSNTTNYENIIISDFQNINSKTINNTNKNFTFVKLHNQQKNNISIDSLFINKNSGNNFRVIIQVKNEGETLKNIPIGIYNNEKLISKQSFDINKNSKKEISFSIQKTQPFLGKLTINFDDAYSFDNSFYFSINNQEKINVLAIGTNNTFLSKIYTNDEFIFTNNNLKEINYNLLPKQQLIIINELDKIPETLASSLQRFTSRGGNLIVIPSTKSNIQSYNNFFNLLGINSSIKQVRNDTLKITKIHTSHPLLKNVFNKKIANFQYPKIHHYFKNTFSNTSSIFSLENNLPFIEQINLTNSKIYWVAAPLNKKNSNFINSPLVVPTFYNIGQQSLQLSKLFYRLSQKNNIDINTSLDKDGVLTLLGKNNSFVPLQQTHQNKVTLTTEEQPLFAGFYAVKKQKDTLTTLSFNSPKNESSLLFLNLNKLKNQNHITVSDSIKNTLQKIKENNKVHWLWKWFLIAVIVFLLLEILILKFFKI